jgi:hypothetical protein
MFRWYQKASACYAYLSDISRELQGNGEIVSSRWFTRGWTLQELLPPSSVEFYTDDWHFIGTKASSGLYTLIKTKTGIQRDFLPGASLREASIAQRMAWAAYREMKRTEDRAYSLLGIFDVNMPLLYGEGEKAFTRLQEAILRNASD